MQSQTNQKNNPFDNLRGPHHYFQNKNRAGHWEILLLVYLLLSFDKKLKKKKKKTKKNKNKNKNKNKTKTKQKQKHKNKNKKTKNQHRRSTIRETMGSQITRYKNPIWIFPNFFHFLFFYYYLLLFIRFIRFIIFLLKYKIALFKENENTALEMAMKC